jgi:hypothetical protein
MIKNVMIRLLMACVFAGPLVGCALDGAEQEESALEADLESLQSQGGMPVTAAVGCSTRDPSRGLGSPFEGRMFCSTTALRVLWSAGQEEDFVIGTDCAVWHSWQEPALGGAWVQWQTLGGCFRDVFDPSWPIALHGNLDGERFVAPPNKRLTVVGVGTDSRYWCRDWPWTGPWYVCAR